MDTSGLTNSVSLPPTYDDVEHQDIIRIQDLLLSTLCTLECTREELYQKCVAAHELYMKSIKSNGDQSGWSKDEHEKFHKGKTVLPELSIYSSNVYTRFIAPNIGGTNPKGYSINEIKVKSLLKASIVPDMKDPDSDPCLDTTGPNLFVKKMNMR